MRKVFPGQFRPTEKQFQEIWKSCIFAVDANVLLNLYRYSPDTRVELETSLESVKEKLFIPHQAAKEFLRNRLIVTAGQAEEYTKAIASITELSQKLSNKKKHPFLRDTELPRFTETVSSIVHQLNEQRDLLLNRMANDEILGFVERLFEGKTGSPFSEEQLKFVAEEGAFRFQNEIPPGYKDVKKDATGDQYRPYGDLIVWKQLINKAKEINSPIIFITDDKKEDWWLIQSGRTISPRTELRDEFISESACDFWMYTVDKFMEEAARANAKVVDQKVIEEIIEVSNDVRAENSISNESYQEYKKITKPELLDRLAYSEKWAKQHSRGGFLGLMSYVKNYLGTAGFEYQSSFEAIRELQNEGLVEVYDHNEDGFERPVKAIRLVTPELIASRPFFDLKDRLKEAEEAD